MRSYFTYVILGLFGVFVAVFLWLAFRPFGAAVCYVNFKGTTYDEAVDLRDALSGRGLEARLDGQRGGPQRTPVVTVDGGFWANAEGLEEDVKVELSQIGGGHIQSCFDGSLGD